MSIVSLILIKDSKISFIREHYREIIRLLEHSKKPVGFLDGGYIVVDFDSKIILDKQTCFSVSDVKNNELKLMKPLL